MKHRLAQFIATQPPEEIARQYDVLAAGKAFRILMTVLVYAIAAIFVPFWLVLGAVLLDLIAEEQGLRRMKGLVPAEKPATYLVTLACIFGVEVIFATVASLIFMEDTGFSKAFAVGILTLTMLQLGSTRTIHFPYAFCGWAGLYLVTLIAALIFWRGNPDVFGLLAILVCIAASAYFSYSTMRTNHSLHDAMARGRAEALAGSETKSRFLAQMSHELRTPLNAILGLGHAERAIAQSPESEERLGLIIESARNLSILLDDILDMSAIQAGHLPIRPDRADPAAELGKAIALYRPAFAAAGLTLATRISDDLPAEAWLDAQRLRQCLSNLLSNALKHTRSGGATVTAARTPLGQLQIEVSDTGRGIPADEAERIFMPFQRSIGAEPGSGLGLSITRALARAMGGDLKLLPSARGACFRLTVGLANIPAMAAPKAITVSPAAPTFFGGHRVLVVDDIASNRLVALAYLRLVGVTADQASSGAEALAILRDDPPDLILLDMNMPDLDGAGTLKLIRTLPSRAAQVPVIAMTANVTEDHRRLYLGAGIDGYLAKPLTPESVAAILRQFLPARS